MLSATTEEDLKVDMSEYEKHGRNETKIQRSPTVPQAQVDIASYRPIVKDRTWYISETDLEWISIGCYILGTGGGGR